MLKRLLDRRWFLAGCLLSLAGCTVQQTEAPALSGPSEFSQGFQMYVTPDSIAQDGGSQSTVTISAFDANGRPRGSANYRLDILVDGTPVDYGTLSSKTVVTGPNGVATATYTAPLALPAGADTPTCRGLAGRCVEIAARAITNDAQGSHTQTVGIRLIPLGVILPPGGTPSASFVFTPGTPSANSPVAFDASASCADTSGGCATTGLTYAWEFGDGRSGTGRTASHSYSTSGTYNVTLTVTNDRNRAASVSHSVSVGAGNAPTAAFVFSPTPVVPQREIFFDASTSRPGTGHTIVRYKWNWGDGFGSPDRATPLEDHEWDIAGVYTVTLTVTDEAGQTGTASQTVSVGSGIPTANFTAVVSDPLTHGVQFDGRSSTTVDTTAAIVDYSWDFGDGSAIGTGAAPVHAYAAAGSYSAKLTVTDSNGKVASVTKRVIAP